METLTYALIGIIVVLIILLITPMFSKSNIVTPLSSDSNCVNTQTIKSKLYKKLFELTFSYKGPLLSFSKQLITVKNMELLLLQTPNHSFTNDDIWFYDSKSKKLQHLSSGMYIKTYVNGDVRVVSVKTEGSDFIYNQGSFQEAEYPNCLSVTDAQKITLGECGPTSSLFFTGQHGQFSFDNKNWYSEPDLVSSFI